MAYQWHFNKVRPGDMIREPIYGEFFSTEAISSPGEALVREAIQNSLDAGRNGESVMVRILVSEKDEGLQPNRVAPYFEGLWQHVVADGNGLRDVPADSEPCSFLVIEDFGTLGLVGDTCQWQPTSGIKNNHFFNFFRAEGRSDKAEDQRGRWGLGKRVFQRSSNISTFLALTVRSDDKRRLLMGQAVLKSHHINGEYYSPDGWFGSLPEGSGDNLVMPVDNKALIDNFVRIFDLQRGENDPGLSIVIPWHDQELTERALLKAVLRDYFWPILMNRLQVLVETPGIKTILDANTVDSELNKIGADLEEELLPLLELARWARDAGKREIVNLNMAKADRALRWSSELFPAEDLKAIRERHEKGDRIALRVNLMVREKDKEPRPSFFDVFFVRDGTAHEGRPVFIREGIIIPDVHSPRTRGVRSLVIVEDKPLAALLGDSENPAHTQWQKDGANFKNKYTYGPSYLSFVASSIHEIVNILCEGAKQEDRALLVDLFSLPALPEEESVKTKTEKDQPTSGTRPEVPPLPPLPPRSRPFAVYRIAGGFVVKKGDYSPNLPWYLGIEVAYHVRRGNPLRKYNPADFEVSKPPIAVEAVDAIVLTAASNHLLIQVENNDFKLAVTGFDQRRDLRVHVSVKEEHHAGKDTELHEPQTAESS